jgi:hypothetical protein
MERRASPRRQVNLALKINGSRCKEQLGITRNVSVQGIQFHSSSSFDLGERVALWVYGEGCDHVDTLAHGTVVRAEREDHTGVVFPHVTAVHLDAPLPKRICRQAHRY